METSKIMNESMTQIEILQMPRKMNVTKEIKTAAAIIAGLLLLALGIYLYLTRYDSRFKVTMDYKIPITYIWIGDQMPSRYKKRLEWVTFPWNLIGQKEWDEWATDFHSYNLTVVEKADILRLLYLQRNAGIYSDFDCIIDYPCLMRMLARKKGFFMAGELYISDYPSASNFFLYADRIEHPLIKNTLEKIKDKLQNMTENDRTRYQRTFFLTGPFMLKSLNIPTIDELYLCMDHQGDYLWNK